MTDKYPPPVQRPALIKLRDALDCQYQTLVRDECGDWRIEGKFGHIYAVPGMTVHGLPPGEGFQIYCSRDTARAWGYARKELALFCRVTQDGDTDGFLFLDRLPTVKQAQVIRGNLGIRKRKALSEDALAALRRRGDSYRFQRKLPASGGSGV